MAGGFAELDYQNTPWGEVILQRRRAFEVDGQTVFEVKLNGEYLMSSLFVDGEVALSDICLKKLATEQWSVVVGGLGLGYTAAAALEYDELARLVVVEAQEPVIDWHRRELVPNGAPLNNDARAEYCHGDFFAMARGEGFDPQQPMAQFDAVLLDIDHTPSALLNPSHGDFYSVEGLQRLKRFIKPGGIFGLWSNDEPEKEFLHMLQAVFETVEGHVVEFDNPVRRCTESNGIYLAQ